MAKKKKEDDENFVEQDIVEEKEKGGGSKIVTFIIALVIVLIWLGVFALLIKLDVGGFGSGVLRPVLKDVPIINKILPAGTEEENGEDSQYPYKNMAEAAARIRELELQVDALTKGGDANGEYIADLQNEVERLKVFEKNQKEFEERQKEFDKEVVFNSKAPDIEEYEKYYAQINPENAAELYQQVVKQMQVDQRVLEQANKYAKMEPATAAQILDIMTAADLDLVCDILANMKDEQAALILAEMEPATAAQITKKMTLME